MNGAALKVAMGTPRSSFRHMSAKVPPTSVMGALNATPAMARQTTRVAKFWATAQGIKKTTATSNVDVYTGFRPIISDMGAKTIGPGNRKYKHADKRVCLALPIWKWGKFKFQKKKKKKN
ncbi:hypothetical protein ACKS23_04691 [Histoplasma ohiense]